jgi:hypothetical protein
MELTSETKVKGIGTLTIATLETRTITVGCRVRADQNRGHGAPMEQNNPSTRLVEHQH